MMGRAPLRTMALAALAMASLCLANHASAADSVSGAVLTAGAPVANSTVTLWAASADAPAQLAQAKTDADGHFALASDARATKMPCSIWSRRAARPRPAGAATTRRSRCWRWWATPRRATVTINEMTTVASVWTNAQVPQRRPRSRATRSACKIAAGNVPNFVDLATGGWGGPIQDPLNGPQTPTMANFATPRRRAVGLRDAR